MKFGLNKMSSSYQPQSVAQYFDEFGSGEWERLVRSPTDEVSLHVHTHYLGKHITPDQQVLEVGAGAGRFTQVLAGLGARILVGDISPVQLDLNRKFAAEYGFDKAVVAWQQLDICDLSCFAPAAFDAVVAYGGPFSYVMDQKDAALAECLRVLKPGGLLLLSVMSLWGSAARFLEGTLQVPPEYNQQITATGDLTAATLPGRNSHFMHMFRARELRTWLEKAGLEMLDLSAANCISLTWNEKLSAIRQDPEKWNELLRMELDAGADEGCWGLGTHLIVVARKG